MRVRVLKPTFVGNDYGGQYLDPDVDGQGEHDYTGPLHLMQTTLEPLREQDRLIVEEARRRHKEGLPQEVSELEVARADMAEMAALKEQNEAMASQLARLQAQIEALTEAKTSKKRQSKDDEQSEAAT